MCSIREAPIFTLDFTLRKPIPALLLFTHALLHHGDTEDTEISRSLSPCISVSSVSPW